MKSTLSSASSLSSIPNDENIIHLPVTVENDRNVPGSQKKKRCQSISSSGLSGRKGGHAFEMFEERDYTKPLMGFAVSTGRMGFSIDGVTEQGEEGVMSTVSRKRARTAALLAASKACSTRREFPSIFPDERKTLKSKLPIQCNPQLAFHHRKSLAAESSRAYSIDSRTSAEAASAAADLYGVDSGEGRGSDDIEPLRTEGIHDDSIPDPRLLSFMSYIAGEKTAKGMVQEKSIFIRRFDQTALISLGILIEELVRDAVLNWARNGHPLVPYTKRSIATAMGLQIQGLSPLPTISSSSSSSASASTGKLGSGEGKSLPNDIKGALKSMLKVLFLTKVEEEDSRCEIGKIIDTMVEKVNPLDYNIGNSDDLAFKSRYKSKSTSNPIPKSEVISSTQTLMESVCTYVDYFPCKHCLIILDSRNKLWQHVKSTHSDVSDDLD